MTAPTPPPAQVTAEQIAEIIEDSDLWVFGIRALHPDELVTVGDQLPESYVWDDGDRSETPIGGTCCFHIGDEAGSEQKALGRALAYYVTTRNRRYALLGGKDVGNNDLIEEANTVAIRDARVLAVWDFEHGGER